MLAMGSRLAFLASLPERLVRTLAAAVGGVVHETAQLLLPRFVRRSRLYEATAKNLLRVTIELVGGVDRPPAPDELEPSAGKLAARKAAGNAVELGSIAAFGFSPLWLLAAASDVTRGTRVYLDAFVAELKQAGVVAEGAELATVDDLLAALEGATGTTARLIDVPPLEVEALRRSLSDLREDATGLPSPAELAALFEGLREVAARSGAACWRYRSAWVWRSSTPRARSAASMCSIRTRRISARSATRALPPTQHVFQSRTRGRWRGTSTRPAGR